MFHSSHEKKLCVALLMIILTGFKPSTGGAQPAFGTLKGVNLNRPFLNTVTSNVGGGQRYNYPNFPAQLCQSVFANLARAGFTGVRINASIVPLMQDVSASSASNLAALNDAVQCAVSEGIKVVLTLQTLKSSTLWPAPQIVNQPAAFDLYIKMVSTVARSISRFNPSQVSLETFNEPVVCEHSTGGLWGQAQERIYKAARANAPKTTLVLTGDCWGTAKGLPSVNAALFDQNTIFSIHFYEPYLFTNQGSYGSSAYTNYILGVHFPPAANDEIYVEERFEAEISRAHLDDRVQRQFLKWAKNDLAMFYVADGAVRPIADALNSAVSWAENQHVDMSRMFVGEFGVRGDYDGHAAAEVQDRAAWLAEVRRQCEDRGFSWAVYSLVDSYGIQTGGLDGTLDPRLLAALGLSPVKESK